MHICCKEAGFVPSIESGSISSAVLMRLKVQTRTSGKSLQRTLVVVTYSKPESEHVETLMLDLRVCFRRVHPFFKFNVHRDR